MQSEWMNKTEGSERVNNIETREGNVGAASGGHEAKAASVCTSAACSESFVGEEIGMTHECAICYEPSRSAILAPCGLACKSKAATNSDDDAHNSRFCEKCLDKYFRDAAGSFIAATIVRCPVQGCKCTIRSNVWGKFVPDSFSAMYEERALASLSVRCPGCDSMGDYKIEPTNANFCDEMAQKKKEDSTVDKRSDCFDVNLWKQEIKKLFEDKNCEISAVCRSAVDALGRISSEVERCELWAAFLSRASIPLEVFVGMYAAMLRKFPKARTKCCNVAVCATCQCPGHHNGMPCSSRIMSMNSSIRECPSCRSAILKADGCNDVTCPCGCRFRWKAARCIDRGFEKDRLGRFMLRQPPPAPTGAVVNGYRRVHGRWVSVGSVTGRGALLQAIRDARSHRTVPTVIEDRRRLQEEGLSSQSDESAVLMGAAPREHARLRVPATRPPPPPPLPYLGTSAESSTPSGTHEALDEESERDGSLSQEGRTGNNDSHQDQGMRQRGSGPSVQLRVLLWPPPGPSRRSQSRTGPPAPPPLPSQGPSDRTRSRAGPQSRTGPPPPRPSQSRTGPPPSPQSRTGPPPPPQSRTGPPPPPPPRSSQSRMGQQAPRPPPPRSLQSRAGPPAPLGPSRRSQPRSGPPLPPATP